MNGRGQESGEEEKEEGGTCLITSGGIDTPAISICKLTLHIFTFSFYNKEEMLATGTYFNQDFSAHTLNLP